MTLLPPLSPLFLPPELGSAFREEVERSSGIRLNEGKTVHVAAAVRERMAELGLTDPAEYHRRILRREGAREELRRLLVHVVVGETCFYRTPDLFRAVQGHILPRLLTSGRERPLRLWSAGCATGEEAWSLAIAATEASGGAPDAVRIRATDLSPDFLEVARRGVYPRSALSTLPPELADRYFRLLPDDRVEVRDELRTLVSFEELNLVEAPPSPLPFCAILCRNVMIYFSPETTSRVVRMFHDSLDPGGYLVLGHSETLWGISDSFRVEERQGAFFFRKEGGDFSRRHKGGGGLKPGGMDHPLRRKGERSRLPAASPRVSPAVPALPAAEGALARLREAERLLERGLLGEAEGACREAAALDPSCAEAWFLLSVASRGAGRDAKALAAAEKALSLEPRLAPALLEAAEALERMGRGDEAGARWNEAVRLLEGDPVLPRLASSAGVSTAMLRDYAVCRGSSGRPHRGGPSPPRG